MQLSQPRSVKHNISHSPQVDQFVCTQNTKNLNVVKFTIKIHVIITVEDA